MDNQWQLGVLIVFVCLLGIQGRGVGVRLCAEISKIFTRSQRWPGDEMEPGEEHVLYLYKMYHICVVRLVAGSVCGAVLVFESVLRRTVWQDKFEMTYVAPNQVLLKSMQDSSVDAMVIESHMGLEIEDIRIMGNHVLCIFILTK